MLRASIPLSKTDTATYCKYCNTLQLTHTTHVHTIVKDRHCSTWLHPVTYCNTPQRTHITCIHTTVKGRHCNTLQHTAKYSYYARCYNCQRLTLQHTATHCNLRAFIPLTRQHTATYCNILQLTQPRASLPLSITDTATRCNTRQHTATHGNILQHTANYTHYCKG